MRTLLTTTLTGLALGVAGLSPYAAAQLPDSPDKGSAIAVGARAEQARTALARAESLFTEHRPVAARSTGAHGGDATLVLRDLYAFKDALSGADRDTAEAILARPTDPADPSNPDESYTETEAPPVCSTVVTVCVHYVPPSSGPVTEDEPDPIDTTPANGIPDYVDAMLSTFDYVHSTYVAAGYRSPLPDDTAGGDDKTDVYIQNVGDAGLYGYCTSDDLNPDNDLDAAAYCVLDNDYSAAEYPTNTPLENMQVTAAHEYFHAVQFAYDFNEDGWIMEATATWAEDELYDAVDDNLSYLPAGPLGKAGVPLDEFNEQLHQYGDWIFFRYLTERFTAKQGPLPKLILELWKKMDGAEVDGVTGPNQYSTQAVETVLKARSTSFRRIFAAFGDKNRRPRSYTEGAANAYPAAPLTGSFILKPTATRSGWKGGAMKHQTNRTFRFTPRNLTATNWRLKLQFDLGILTSGSAATVSVYKKTGAVVTSPITLNSSGNAARTFTFSNGSIKWVEVTLTNASLRTSCWANANDPTSPWWACFGQPKDNAVKNLVAATAFRA